jgi:alanine-glyoxylate transaminase/serine-glyoxylate transaminase/serine-pyruvate transaminase
LELRRRAPSGYSSSLAAVRLTPGRSADALRKLVLERFNMSLDRVFRIGRLGDFNDLSLIGALAGVEMGLRVLGLPYGVGGGDAAMATLAA